MGAGPEDQSPVTRAAHDERPKWLTSTDEWKPCTQVLRLAQYVNDPAPAPVPLRGVSAG